jgi:hypothetical protein
MSFLFIKKSRIGLYTHKNKHCLRSRQRVVMAAKLTRLIYQIATRRDVASEICRLISCCRRSWQWVLKLFDTPSYDRTEKDTVGDLWRMLSSVKFGAWGFHGGIWSRVISQVCTDVSETCCLCLSQHLPLCAEEVNSKVQQWLPANEFKPCGLHYSGTKSKGPHSFPKSRSHLQIVGSGRMA